MLGGDTGNEISKLCANQATKNGSVHCLWSVWEHTGMKKWQIKKCRNEVCSDIFKLKNTKMNWQKYGSVQTEIKL